MRAHHPNTASTGCGNGKHQLKIGELPDVIDLEMEEQDGVQSCVVPVLSTRVGLWVNLTDDVITWITDSVLAAGAIARVAAPGTFRRRRQADWKKARASRAWAAPAIVGKSGCT